MRYITDLSAMEAKQYFLQSKQYCNIPLPKYFDFSNLLLSIDEYLSNTQDDTKLAKETDVNYKIFSNKDGKYAWRKFQLINPLGYTKLARLISDESNWDTIVKRLLPTVKPSNRSQKIICASIPIINQDKSTHVSDTINNWWTNVEQKSIKLALEFRCITHIDISACYDSIYTHAIAWALHGKEETKRRRSDKNLLGNQIDTQIRALQNGESVGIPQGNVISDVIAELVLASIDDLIIEELKQNNVKDYKIIRYRDDYRIFTNSIEDGSKIVATISRILSEYNFSLNQYKTATSEDIITSSVKKDKIATLMHKESRKGLQKSLLLIYVHSKDFQNSGSVRKMLDRFNNRIEKHKNIGEDVDVLISILVEIIYNNPLTYSVGMGILSRILDKKTKRDKVVVLNKIIKKFKKLPNSELFDIWIQRLVLPIKFEHNFNTRLCKIVSGNKKKHRFVEFW